MGLRSRGVITEARPPGIDARCRVSSKGAPLRLRRSIWISQSMPTRACRRSGAADASDATESGRHRNTGHSQDAASTWSQRTCSCRICASYALSGLGLTCQLARISRGALIPATLSVMGSIVFLHPGFEELSATISQPASVDELARELEVFVNANDQQLFEVTLTLDDDVVATPFG